MPPSSSSSLRQLQPYFVINTILSLVIVLPYFVLNFEKAQLLESPQISDNNQPASELARLNHALKWTLNIPLVLGVILLFRFNRAQSLRQFLPLGFMAAKVGAMVAIFLWHPPYCLFYLVAVVVGAIVLPLPPFEGASHVEGVTEDYVRGEIMKQTSTRHATIHVVEFCAPWSNKCLQFSETYAQLSLQ